MIWSPLTSPKKRNSPCASPKVKLSPRRAVAVAVELLSADGDLDCECRQRVTAIRERAEFGFAAGEVIQCHDRHAIHHAGARRKRHGPATGASERERTRDGPGESDFALKVTLSEVTRDRWAEPSLICVLRTVGPGAT